MESSDLSLLIDPLTDVHADNFEDNRRRDVQGDTADTLHAEHVEQIVITAHPFERGRSP